MESVERHGDSHGRHSPLHSVSRNANEKSSYRLFPIANQRPQVSPRTLQRETLSRNGSISKRRSASLDDSSRPQFAAARGPPSRNGPAPVPRLQPVPADRQKGTKPQAGQQSCMSHPEQRTISSPTNILPKLMSPTYSPISLGSQTMAVTEGHPVPLETSPKAT